MSTTTTPNNKLMNVIIIFFSLLALPMICQKPILAMDSEEESSSLQEDKTQTNLYHTLPALGIMTSACLTPIIAHLSNHPSYTLPSAMINTINIPLYCLNLTTLNNIVSSHIKSHINNLDEAVDEDIYIRTYGIHGNWLISATTLQTALPLSLTILSAIMSWSYLGIHDDQYRLYNLGLSTISSTCTLIGTPIIYHKLWRNYQKHQPGEEQLLLQ